MLLKTRKKIDAKFIKQITSKYIDYDVIILLELKNNKSKTSLNYWYDLDSLRQVPILNLVHIAKEL